MLRKGRCVIALDSFVAGRYTCSWNAADVGITNEGIELQQESSWEAVDRSDAYGDSIIDGVFRGGNVYLGFEAKAFKAGSVAPFWPWNTLGMMASAASPIGQLASSLAAALVLAAVSGTAFNTAGALVINSLTAAGAILAPNVPQRLLFHSRLRQVPIRLIAIPYANSGNTIWFVTS